MALDKVYGFDDIRFRLPANKTIVLDPTVYDDLRVPMNALKTGPSAPGFEGAYFAPGLYVYKFDGTSGEQLFFAAQLPHSYKEGTDIIPHVHWYPDGLPAADDRQVVWRLGYDWANQDAAFSGETTLDQATATFDIADRGKHFLTSFAALDGTGKTISSILLCVLSRLPGDPLDNYAGDAGLLEFDFHFQKDTIGSRFEITK